jgi:site-specific DNA recombinase
MAIGTIPASVRMSYTDALTTNPRCPVSKKKPAPVPRNKAVIYIRVSTQEQVENLSLETQEARCRELCERKGWPPVRVFREEGQSAKTTRRDEFQRMLSFCKDHKNGVGFIVVYDLSRFARNMLDQLDTERELRESGVRLESVMEPAEDTAAGRLHRNMLAAWHQFDNDRRSERTVAGMTQAAKRGRFPFKAPIGYINVSQHQGHNLIPDPKIGPLITKAFELFATGNYRKAEVLKKVNALGLATRKGQPMSMQTFQKLMENPIYAGWVVIPKWDMRVQGAFEPLVTQHTFDTVQDVLRGRKVVAKAYDRNNKDFPLRRFVRCGLCGTPMTGGAPKGKLKRYPYYWCRKGCSFGNIRRDDLEEKFIRLLQWLRPSTDLVAEFKNSVRSEWKRRQGDAEAAYAAIQTRLAKARERKDKLINLRLDGDIDQSTYREQDDRLTKEIDAAGVELRQAESQFLDLEGVLGFAEKIVTAPTRMWLESSIDQRQRLQQVLFPQGLTFDGKAFGTPANSSFFDLLRGYFEVESLLASPTGFEPVLSP